MMREASDLDGFLRWTIYVVCKRRRKQARAHSGGLSWNLVMAQDTAFAFTWLLLETASKRLSLVSPFALSREPRQALM